MKVYLADDAGTRLIGRADVPEDCGPVYEVPLFGAAATIVESFTIGNVTMISAGSNTPTVERAVLAAQGQLVDLLPGWEPLAS